MASHMDAPAGAMAFGFTPGQGGQPILYPAPFVIRNTFIDFNEGRPPSLDEFVQVRQVRSCPTSAIMDPEGEPVPQGGGWACHMAAVQSMPNQGYTCVAPGQAVYAPAAVMGPQAAEVMRQQAQGCPQQQLPLQPLPAGPSQLPLQQRCWVPGGAEGGGGNPAEGAVQFQQAAPAAPQAPQPAAAPVAQEDLPSMGSAGHYLGQCRPCAFVNSRGCVSGKDCQFCHLCEPGEKKRRQKEKKAFFNTMRQLQQSMREGWPSRWG